MVTENLRIGCLGAARIVPMALVRPAAKVAGVELAAIAARDPERARAFAAKRGIPVVHESYEALVADDSLDAVYVPLPNGLHGYWTKRAVEAGRHVLCEKPLTANAEEAAEVAKAADASGLVVMEAFHWRYHALAERMLDIIAKGELGAVRRVEAEMSVPLHRRDDIRWRLDLAGGAMMDAGCYTVSMVRTLAGAEPEVVSARAKLRSPGVDRRLRAELVFGDGRTGSVTASMWSARVFRIEVVVTGEKATMRVLNPMAPQYFHRLTVKGPNMRRREKIGGPGTYTCQLEAFAAAVRGERPPLTPASDSVLNMRVIDAAYRAAGLEPRQPTAV
jgi:predicted dehydrogenase